MLRRLLNPFVIVLSLIVIAGYSYLASSIAESTAFRITLILPFFLVWIVPVRYWVNDRESKGLWDDLIHYLSYLSMGWLNFLIALTLARDVLQVAATWLHASTLQLLLQDVGTEPLVIGSFIAMVFGMLAAIRGPKVRHVDIVIDGLDAALDGFRIVQISDLHARPTIGRRYVQSIVAMTNSLKPDLIALTGDLVDGSVPRLTAALAPFADFESKFGSFLVLGNHEYYAGAQPWIAHFKSLKLNVLLNESVTINANGATLLIGGVIDPAATLYEPGSAPRPDLAIANIQATPGRGVFRLLLAHNPKIAAKAAASGFDLQLSGHTHAGQFFPWTLAVHMVHAPHVAGLSRQGPMWVYVSAGTGTWGPPIRLGTATELTVLHLVKREDRLTRGKSAAG